VRWRLEKKDPAAAVSEPVKPIVYYVDPATPAKWVPYVKKGVEAWQPAFEEAGFRRAIIARDAPSPSEDPDWSPEDARYEVGHTLGLPHNFKASSLYPIAKIRDPEWLRTMGHVPTLMDYSRFNYVAQPEDKVPPELLIPKIGPYDKFAIMWGYKPIPGAARPEDERATLGEWLKAQETSPHLRFSAVRAAGSDPGENTEAVGDADAIQATTLGTRNLQRVMDMLLKVVPKPDENYEELGALYAAVLGQWNRELNHVAAIVGGFDSQEKYGGQPGVVFTPVSRERQKAAVKYLNDAVFATPAWVVRPEIIRRVEPVGGLSRLLGLQRSVLATLLNSSRLGRLQEQEAIDGEKAYKPTEFLADLRGGLFTELNSAAPSITSYRRNLQRAYLDLIDERLNGRAAPAAAADDTRALFRGELRAIDGLIAARLAGVEDEETCWPDLALPYLPQPRQRSWPGERQ
jgi:hypothetical protein